MDKQFAHSLPGFGLSSGLLRRRRRRRLGAGQRVHDSSDNDQNLISWQRREGIGKGKRAYSCLIGCGNVSRYVESNLMRFDCNRRRGGQSASLPLSSLIKNALPDVSNWRKKRRKGGREATPSGRELRAMQKISRTS